ncbi:PREDICTED: uncharacterized protein LOC105359941 [Ceratosolen solmsi marchali]|uniref:Uncharacterized protein LOC105359941 n=1 Tax=Ceratosolen solmsi marchali TaxID=326594 RepID=A0AAJ6VL40_9HYME|nr:PREDICTED: uncharacterized protein LOC105359941 [Ceratosolen solmsi marchali]
MYLRFCSSEQIKKIEYIRPITTKSHFCFQPIKAIGLRSVSAFLFDRDIFWLNNVEYSHTVILQQGMSKFAQIILDFQIGWRKLTDPGD